MALPQSQSFIFSKTPAGDWGVLQVGHTKSIYKDIKNKPIDVLVNRKDGKTVMMRLGKFWGAKTENLSETDQSSLSVNIRGGLYSAIQTPK